MKTLQDSGAMPNKKIVFDSDEDASEDELGETTLASAEGGEENKTDKVKMH